MPDFRHINCEVICWNCQSCIDEQVDIQWGKVPGKSRIGDRVDWLRIGGKVVPPFVLVKGHHEWNCGDANEVHVIAFDNNLYAIDSLRPFGCPRCNAPISGVGVTILHNVVSSASTYSPDDLRKLLGPAAGRADVVVIREDGHAEPKTEWFDHTVRYVPNL
jgi:hypothetical protein